MPSLSELPRILRFGLFEVDLRAHELRRSGVRLKLQEQPFEVLSLLLERPGEVVTREELRDRLWPADTFVDFDHSVNAAIKRLRDALGDSADNPRFVETLARRGYRFIAHVENGAGVDSANRQERQAPGANGDCYDSTSEIGDARAEKPLSGQPQFSRVALFGLVVIVAMIPLGVYSWRSRSPLALRPEMKVVPITSSPGAEIRPHFSPDGKEIAFISEPENSRTADLFVKLIGGDSPVRLAQNLGLGSALAWSPDGRYIAFGRCPGPSGIWIVPALGGMERQLVDHYGCDFQGLSWSPDGKFLTFADKPSPDEGWSIYRFSLETQQETRLTFPPPHTVGDHIPDFSPDGSRIVFRRISSPAVTDIYVVAAQGGEANRITFDRGFIQGLAWTPDSKSIVFAAHRLGTTGLWRVPATAGGVVEPIPIAGPMVGSPAVSLERNRLAFTRGFMHGEIWRVELNPSGKTEPAAPFISSSWGDGGPQFSPDGKRIVFSSSRSGSFEIWRCNSDGSDPIQLTSLGVLSGSPRWSPDGGKIAFDSRPGDHGQILIINADGGPPQQITSGNYENEVPNWSHDGKWIYFGSNRSGNWQLWRVSVRGGDPIRLTQNNGFFATESPDGGTIYYTKEETDGIWQMPVTGGDAKRILAAPVYSWGDWTVLHNGIYFINREGLTLPSTVRFYEFRTRKLSTIARMDRAIPLEEPDFDISPDGKTILYGQVNKSVDIMMVENFH